MGIGLLSLLLLGAAVQKPLLELQQQKQMLLHRDVHMMVQTFRFIEKRHDTVTSIAVEPDLDDFDPDDEYDSYARNANETLVAEPLSIESTSRDLVEELKYIFGSFSFKGFGLCLRKSVVSWYKVGIAVSVPITTNFPVYDKTLYLPKIAMGVGLTYPGVYHISITTSMSLRFFAVLAIMMKGFHGSFQKAASKLATVDTMRRIGFTYSWRFYNDERGCVRLLGPYLNYLPNFQVYETVEPYLIAIPALILSFLNFVAGEMGKCLAILRLYTATGRFTAGTGKRTDTGIMPSILSSGGISVSNPGTNNDNHNISALSGVRSSYVSRASPAAAATMDNGVAATLDDSQITTGSKVGDKGNTTTSVRKQSMHQYMEKTGVGKAWKGLSARLKRKTVSFEWSGCYYSTNRNSPVSSNVFIRITPFFPFHKHFTKLRKRSKKAVFRYWNPTQQSGAAVVSSMMSTFKKLQQQAIAASTALSMSPSTLATTQSEKEHNITSASTTSELMPATAANLDTEKVEDNPTILPSPQRQIFNTSILLSDDDELDDIAQSDLKIEVAEEVGVDGAAVEVAG
mmetsp:Transcript_8113/g.13491  ORF Transcript_8113/g.13491 Transcript_8113/m.13491 type:complete len:570 (+) Transcript_8113:52-1761(+)